MSITLTVEDGTIKLPAGVNVPNGTEVRVFLPEAGESPAGGATLFELMGDLIGSIKDGPEDLAAEHDHYAHGAPKRSEL